MAIFEVDTDSDDAASPLSIRSSSIGMKFGRCHRFDRGVSPGVALGR